MIADVIVISIIALSAYIGYKRGFVRSISRMLCFVVSILAAKLLYPKTSEFVSNSVIGDMIRSKVAENAQGYMGENPPTFIQQASDYTAGGISDMLISVVTIIAIIVVTYFITKIFSASLHIVSKLPVISFFNRVAGLVIGGLLGVFIAYAAVSLIVFYDVSGTTAWLDDSVIAYTMYRGNFLFDLIF